jgi:site-specific DNA-cytosine methylase
MTKNLRWGTIVPLIGGLTVAGEQVTGVQPEVLFSYVPFGENEKNVKANFPNTPHFNIDDDHAAQGYDENKYKDMDFISAVCPCAGLSMLSSGSAEQRATQNKWMLETSKYVLGTLRPKVFWGENAPTLYTNRGQEIKEFFQDVAEKNGYSLSLYHTDSIHHGIPQNRKRTFYFFWRDSAAPELHYYKRDRKNLADYLAEIPEGVSGHTKEDLQVAHDTLYSNPYMQFLQHKYNGDGLKHMRQVLVDRQLDTMTLIRYMFVTEQWNEARAYFVTQGMDRQIREIDRIKAKIESGGGIWDGSMSLYRPDGDFSAMIGRKLDSIHPVENRILTPRECMHLMALPHDFELVTGNLNHVCQNVPVCTGGDMVREVMGYLNGERTLTDAKFLMQSNIKERTDTKESKLFNF